MEPEDGNDAGDELSELQAVSAIRELEGGREKDRRRRLRREIKRAAAFAQVWLIILTAASGLLANLMAARGEMEMCIGYGVFFGVYGGCYLWSRRKLLPPVVAAAVVFSIVSILTIVETIQSTIGIPVRVGGIAFMVIAVAAALKHKKLKRQLDSA